MVLFYQYSLYPSSFILFQLLFRWIDWALKIILVFLISWILCADENEPKNWIWKCYCTQIMEDIFKKYNYQGKNNFFQQKTKHKVLFGLLILWFNLFRILINFSQLFKLSKPWKHKKWFFLFNLLMRIGVFVFRLT